MEKLVLDVPAMYADHHVLTVREALAQLEGVEQVYASSAWKQIMLSFDPAKANAERIQSTLTEAGFPPGKGEPPILVKRNRTGRDPQWDSLSSRVTVTHPADLKHVR